MRKLFWLFGSLCIAACATAPAPLPVVTAAARAEAKLAVARGSRLFRNDRMAWLASDIYRDELERANVPPPKSVDWAITEAEEGGHLVAFILDQADAGGFVDAEVYFPAEVDPDACIRADEGDEAACQGISIARGVRSPSAVEQAWAVARRRMLGDPQLRRCTEVPPNFTVLVEAEQTLGYVLSATLKRSTVVMSGHTRYQLSPDGAEILAREPLFTSCIVVEREDDQPIVALMLSSTTADLFNESHVYLALDQRQPVYVIGRLGHRVVIESQAGLVQWRLLD